MASSKGLIFTVDSLPGEFTLDLRQNVKKNISNIHYLKVLPDDAVKLAYVGSRPIGKSNLFLGDRSLLLNENSHTELDQEFISDESTSSINIKNTNLLVTQEFLNNMPLYFQHSLGLNIKPDTVILYDKDFNPVPEDQYKIELIYEYDEDTGIRTDTAEEYKLYNSLENTFDNDTGEFDCYFVQYKKSSNETETTILNNEPIYQKAGFDDIWYLTNALKPWVKAYTLDGFLLRLPASNKFAIKYLQTKRLSVVQPSNISVENPWVLEVVNGSFQSGYYGYSNLYSVPEYSNQSFYPIEPYALAARELCYKVADRIVKFPHDSILLDRSSYLSILVTHNETVQYAVTNDPTLIGKAYIGYDGKKVYSSAGYPVEWTEDYLLGFDRYSGFAYLSVDIDDEYKTYATYTYKKNTYSLSSMVANPIFDQTLLKQMRVIFAEPQNSKNNNINNQSSAIKWMKISELDKIIYVNDETLNDPVELTSASGFSIKNLNGLNYSKNVSTKITSYEYFQIGSTINVISTANFPRQGWIRVLGSDGSYRYGFYESKTNTSFTLSSDTTKAPNAGYGNIDEGETIELVNFVDEFSIRTSKNGAEEFNRYGDSGLPNVFARYFVLAEVSIKSSHGIDKATKIDVRDQGGKLLQDKYEDAKLKNPYVQSLNENYALTGQLYPGNAVNVVRLPIALLDEFSKEKIEEIVKLNTPMGVLPIVKFYGYEANIVSVDPGQTTVSVEWEKAGGDFVYNIWYSVGESGPWIRHNNVRIQDTSDANSTNTYVINGLEKDTQYYVKITMQDKYYYWWYSQDTYDHADGGLGARMESLAGLTHPGGNYKGLTFSIV